MYILDLKKALAYCDDYEVLSLVLEEPYNGVSRAVRFALGLPLSKVTELKLTKVTCCCDGKSTVLWLEKLDDA